MATKKTSKKKDDKPKVKRPRAQQLKVPGTERKEIPELTKAASEYREIRDERMDLTKKEKAAMTALAELCAKHEVSEDKPYIYEDEDGRLRRVTAKPASFKISVRLLDSKTEDDDGDEVAVEDDDAS